MKGVYNVACSVPCAALRGDVLRSLFVFSSLLSVSLSASLATARFARVRLLFASDQRVVYMVLKTFAYHSLCNMCMVDNEANRWRMRLTMLHETCPACFALCSLCSR